MLLRKDVKHYENEQKLARERREKREKLDEALAQAQRKEMDRKHFKINRIMKQVIFPRYLYVDSKKRSRSLNKL